MCSSNPRGPESSPKLTADRVGFVKGNRGSPVQEKRGTEKSLNESYSTSPVQRPVGPVQEKRHGENEFPVPSFLRDLNILGRRP
jgi:hypothetical protein